MIGNKERCRRADSPGDAGVCVQSHCMPLDIKIPFVPRPVRCLSQKESREVSELLCSC